VAAGASAAEASPATATNRAKKRMADFIFSNLSVGKIGREKFSSGLNFQIVIQIKQVFSYR
jgi:hypothetical protein